MDTNVITRYDTTYIWYSEQMTVKIIELIFVKKLI